MAEHFVRPPEWTWYVLAYFFLGGMTGGLYAIGAMLRLWGRPADEGVARTAFLWAFPILVICPILLTIDLGQPLRFFHMLVATTPGEGGLIFRYWSPMSAGSWALLLFGVFAFVSFLRALGRRSNPGGGRLFVAIGGLLGLFVASYTGVLLSVSNQPLWSDTWTLGGLFLASGLNGAAALLVVVARRDAAPAGADARLHAAEGYFALIELIWILLLFATLAAAGTLATALQAPWIILWLIVLVGLIPPLMTLGGRDRMRGSAALIALLVLAGALALRAAIIFSVQG
ncbi:MAG TPA: NrfD/PsrC family molybdoenzyme membrane anchor subunit [bacterium]|nr:NrfD/PsrC family molybdoenzyme membrane anchor subunit [bacterium]